MGKIKPIKSKLKLAKILLDRYEGQTANGFLIKCSDGKFFVDEDCFKFSDFLYEQIQGRSSHLEGRKIWTTNRRSGESWPVVFGYFCLICMADDCSKLEQSSMERKITFSISQHSEFKQLGKSLT